MLTTTEIIFLIILCLMIGSLIYLLLNKPNRQSLLKDKIGYYLLLSTFIIGPIVLLVYYLLYVLLLKKSNNNKDLIIIKEK